MYIVCNNILCNILAHASPSEFFNKKRKKGATLEQEYFNFKLSSSRMVIECLFGQLKSGFRDLMSGLQFRSVELPCTSHNIITACELCSSAQLPDVV